MIQVYSAEHPAEAYIVKGILETNGIECQVRGDILFAARGEIPLSIETAPSVWIIDEQRYMAARDLVSRYERANAGKEVAGPSWLCPGCGEKLEGQFTHCWQCGHARGFPKNSLGE